ncbi:MAG: AI-2E family transporter [Bacilli bacterium]|nr:AI-2E family transporter [Bacilli bacterium]MDD3896070.1 AI-2E family transporter [Bacilli bacterium]MDD4407988.1 AI-2E family transporter [Bacilli bacterium]
MKYIKKINLLDLFLVLINILLVIFIIEKFQILGFCYTMVTLISPIFFGYAVAWFLKPLMVFFNKYFNDKIAVFFTYLLIILFLSIISYLAVPIIINEIKSLIPQIINIYENLNPIIIDNVDFKAIGTKVITILNRYTISIKDILLNIFYALFISYFFLIKHAEISKFLGSKLPSELINRISINLRSFVKGTFITTLILFVMSIISFWIAKLPYAFLFAIIISITNIIPFIGPYIGGVPSVIVAFNVSANLGIIVLIIILALQLIESIFINPYIMSKSIKINPIFIIISLIIFGYFFGIIGMLLSTPIITIIKTLYLYNKEFEVINFKVLGK